MRITEFIDPELVITGLTADGVAETLDRFVERLHAHGLTDEPDTLRELLRERESAHTTCLGNGVAIPHATAPELQRTVILVATAPEGVAYGPPADQPVRVFFLLLSPPHRASEHIKLLARIVRLARDPLLLDRLAEAPTGEAVRDELARVERGHV